MENLKVVFDIMSDGKTPPFHYTKESGNFIIDLRMMVERKAGLVKDGHKTPQPEWSNFSGVVSHESIRIDLTYAALNDQPVFGSDIQN